MIELTIKYVPFLSIIYEECFFTLGYAPQFETENVIVLLLFMFALAGSSKLSVGDRGKNPVHQMAVLIKSILLEGKCLFAPLITRGSYTLWSSFVG